MSRRKKYVCIKGRRFAKIRTRKRKYMGRARHIYMPAGYCNSPKGRAAEARDRRKYGKMR